MLAQVVKQHLAGFRSRMLRIPDPRLWILCFFGLDEIIFSAILLFIFRRESRNKMNLDRRDQDWLTSVATLFNIKIPHMDTVQRVFRRLDASHLEKLMADLIKKLIEKKLFRSGRWGGKHHLVALDATGVGKAKKGDEGTLFKISKKGKRSDYRMVTVASLVMPGGFSLPLACEWIEGEFESKQDCELKSFKRLAVKLKGFYPRLPICILADGLYAGKPFFDLCRDLKWEWCIVLKDGKLSTIWDQVDEKLLDEEAKNNIKNLLISDGDKIEQTTEWIGGLKYKETQLTWIEMIEKKQGETTKFCFITSLLVNSKNVLSLVQAGRLRWKIEDVFNTQKNRGFNLLHKYSRRSFTATKNWFLCLQMGHMFTQLVDMSKKASELMDHSKETISHLWELAREALTLPIDSNLIDEANKRTQFHYK